MIYFVDGLNAMVVKALQDSSDWADILNDLRRIDDKLRCGSGTEEDAYELDYELRNKYPAIHAMLQIAALAPSPFACMVAGSWGRSVPMVTAGTV